MIVYPVDANFVVRFASSLSSRCNRYGFPTIPYSIKDKLHNQVKDDVCGIHNDSNHKEDSIFVEERRRTFLKLQ